MKYLYSKLFAFRFGSCEIISVLILDVTLFINEHLVTGFWKSFFVSWDCRAEVMRAAKRTLVPKPRQSLLYLCNMPDKRLKFFCPLPVSSLHVPAVLRQNCNPQHIKFNPNPHPVATMKCGDTLNTTSPSGAHSCRPTLYEVRRGGAAWLDDPGFEFRYVQNNLLPPKRPERLYCQHSHLKWIPEISPGGILITNLHLAPKLAMSGAITLLPRYASMAWTWE